MDAEQLALKMIEYGKLARQLQALEDEIAGAVLQLGKTQTVANVRASYSKGRKTYDYQRTVNESDNPDIEETVTLYTQTVLKTDWKGVCAQHGLTPIVKSQSPPSVRLKLLD